MVGGMEKLGFALAKEFSRNTDTTLITWGKSQKYLPLIIPLFFLKALYLIPAKKITHIHLGDALLSPLGLLLKILFNLKVTTTVCGLDITYKFPPYQFIVPKCVKRLDKVICISNATLKECTKRGIPADKCIVIPCGVYPGEFLVNASRKDLEKITGKKLTGKKVIITVGRLVERKGVYWFIKNVFPKLDKNIIYLIIGDGPDKQKIANIIKKINAEDRIFLLGKVSDSELKIIYNTSDLFVMPNIPVKGDIEGFGIVALEAASGGIPIVATKTEGIIDALRGLNTNFLQVEPLNKEEFVKQTNKVIKSFKKLTGREKTDNILYSWNNISKNYTSVFNKLNLQN